MAQKEVISVIGLGYVGLPVASAFARKFKTIGFDINAQRIDELKKGFDRTGEVEPQDFQNPNLVLSADPASLREASFHIVTVPTPIDNAHRPDLTPVIAASRTVGKQLKKGDLVVYESTVYPGLTEEKCYPILEKESGLKVGLDFKVGYSPERVNPGDKLHRFETIKKVVSGMDAESLQRVADVYGSVVEAGVYKASSIKVAEAAKVIENTQRDLNVALINELSLIFHRMGIDTNDVLEAAGTKWNFLKFTPGLVGGHCIGVDPYYLTHKAEEIGYIPQVILAGRRVNDSMGHFVAEETVKLMVKKGVLVKNSVVTVLGVTFKENCPDIRNSRVFDIVQALRDYDIQVQMADPMADSKDVEHEHNLKLTPFESLKPAAAVIVAVSHEPYKKMSFADLKKLISGEPILVDIKSIFDRVQAKQNGIQLWRL